MRCELSGFYVVHCSTRSLATWSVCLQYCVSSYTAGSTLISGSTSFGAKQTSLWRQSAARAILSRFLHVIPNRSRATELSLACGFSAPQSLSRRYSNLISYAGRIAQIPVYHIDYTTVYTLHFLRFWCPFPFLISTSRSNLASRFFLLYQCLGSRNARRTFDPPHADWPMRRGS